MTLVFISPNHLQTPLPHSKCKMKRKRKHFLVNNMFCFYFGHCLNKTCRKRARFSNSHTSPRGGIEKGSYLDVPSCSHPPALLKAGQCNSMYFSSGAYNSAVWGWQSYLQICLERTEKFQLKQTLLSSPGILEMLLLPCKTISVAQIIAKLV